MIAAALVAAILAAVCALTVPRFFRALPRRAALGASAALCGLVIAAPASLLGIARLKEADGIVHPLLVGYATSNACLECHPSSHASWHRTYHRTMTREATPENVLGDFSGVEFLAKGLPAKLYRRGDRFFMSLVDPDWEERERARGRDPSTAPNPPRVEWTVDRVVGSHNMQVYLTRLDDGRYIQLPLEWHVASRRWLDQSGLLTPEGPNLYQSRDNLPWNLTCVFCHNTEPNPRFDGRAAALHLETTVAELGIACEACHGPAERHIAANRNPLRRLWIEAADRGDPTIVNPARLTQQDSVEACGRCHGKWGSVRRAVETQNLRGDLFRPGPWGLAAYYNHGPVASKPHREESEGSWYWPDGTPRPTSMEYQGVLSSPCYLRGELTCVSCHSMHAADPDGQLRFVEAGAPPRRERNEMCTQCHAPFAGEAELAAHTRHPAGSEGSRCVACHMPYLTWGLMKPIRTHRISSPDAGASAANAMPNACNQCHVDRSLGWTADALTRWYGVARPTLSSEAESTSATIVDLVRGHAVHRVLAASRLGAADAREAAPGAWRASFLIEALDDPYMVIRFAAEKALRTISGFEQLDYDFLAPPAARQGAIETARATEPPALRSESPPASIPLADGKLGGQVAALRAQRFDPPITLVE